MQMKPIRRQFISAVASYPFIFSIGEANALNFPRCFASHHEQDQADPKNALVAFKSPKTYQVRHAIVFNVGDNDLTELELWVPVPQNSAAQSVENLKANLSSEYYVDKSKAIKIACYQPTENFPVANSSFTYEVTYKLTASSTVLQHANVQALEQKLAAKGDSWYDPAELNIGFLHKEKFVELESDRIKEIAADLKQLHKTPFAIAHAAYAWILDRVQYQLIEGLGGAKYCIENAHGECGDYSALFVAICRAAGIPARPVVGFWAHGENQWHVWAEFMMPGGTWIPCDPSVGDQNRRKREFYFGNLDNNRVILNRTFNFEIEKPGEHKGAEFLQVGAWWYFAKRNQGQPSVEYIAEVKPLDQ